MLIIGHSRHPLKPPGFVTDCARLRNPGADTLSPMAASDRRQAAELLARVPVLRDPGARGPRAGRPGRRAARASSPARSSSARATTATRATSCAPATPARCASTPTGARSRSRTSARATSSASWRCSTTSAARRPSRRSTTLEALAILGSDMRRLMREHPDIAVKLVIALGRRLREANERLARQSFQTVQSRVAAVLDAARASRRSAEGAGDARRARRPITQADIAQLAGSSRESASRFLAVLERAGRDHAGPRAAHGPRPRRAAAATSTELGEVSAGGVVVRGDECVVIVPTRRAADGASGARAAQGPSRGGRDARARPRCARCARRPASRRELRRAARRRALLVPARRPARSPRSSRFFLLRLRRAATPTTTTTRSSEARWMPLERGRARAHLRGRARDGRARPVAHAHRPSRLPPRCRSSTSTRRSSPTSSSAAARPRRSGSATSRTSTARTRWCW